MRCPHCADELEPGEHRCPNGSYYLHPWAGGAVLLCPGGTWVWRSELASWECLERPVAPDVTEVPDKPVVPAKPAGWGLQTTVTVTTTSGVEWRQGLDFPKPGKQAG